MAICAYFGSVMNRTLNRREILSGWLVAGAALALPLRALADPLSDTFDTAFAGRIKPVETAPPPPAPWSMSPNYRRRLFEVATRERDRNASRLWRHDVVGIADFAQQSAHPRLHFANLENGTVRSFLVAHGRGSDPEHDGWLKNFSNEMGSEATSRGAYLTCEWYRGKYGTSIRLEGLDRDNNMALDRAIVMHSAWYVDSGMVGKWGKIGRSEGCFAMAPGDFNEALWHLSGGKLLFADRIGEV